MNRIAEVKKIMAEFAESTGLSKPEMPARRYLWTDAFAVCNFLGLYQDTADKNRLDSALRLVDQVHRILGRHRKDELRSGWISGMSEEEGRRHPTLGGLRIGKNLKEREPDEPLDERVEWDRDGQYYHYLTKWMHALNRVSRVTKDATFNSWAMELAKSAHDAFVYDPGNGSKRMYWKMSIDLSRPQVRLMGQHDPLDGLITYKQLRETAAGFSKASQPNLDAEIHDLESLCVGQSWATEDPLGVGGLLTDIYRIIQLMPKADDPESHLLVGLAEASRVGLDAYLESGSHKLPARYRLAFRELGLSIGLHAVSKAKTLILKREERASAHALVRSQIREFESYNAVGKSIEAFWLEPENRKSPTWMEHKDINGVMLATSLAPDGYLDW